MLRRNNRPGHTTLDFSPYERDLQRVDVTAELQLLQFSQTVALEDEIHCWFQMKILMSRK